MTQLIEFVPVADAPNAAVEAAMSGDTAALHAWLDAPVAHINTLLALAAQADHVEGVRLLLPYARPLDDDSLALRVAAVEGHLDCLHLLLPHSDVHAEGGDAAYKATYRGRTECLRALLDRTRDLIPALSATQSWVPFYHERLFCIAADAGHVDCLDVLLPWVNPASNLSEALFRAVIEGHSDCVQFLRPLCSAEEAWDRLLPRQEWQAMDDLAAHVPLGKVLDAWAQIPDSDQDMLPQMRCRVETHVLSSTIAATGLGTPRSRL